jgi:flavin-dependent dehydrogenase
LPSDQKITLCGEAAGLTKPWSGGGVVWGLKMAEILIKNFPDFQKYKKEAENFFRPQIFFSEILTRMVYFFGFNFPWFLPKQHKIDGDFI